MSGATSGATSGEIVVYDAGNGEMRVEVRLEEDTVWLSQRQMGRVFETTPENVLMHLRGVFQSGALEAEATTKDFLVVRSERGPTGPAAHPALQP